jgi:gliding motility-associated-like protein
LPFLYRCYDAFDCRKTNSGSCGDATDVLLLTIQPASSADAGTDLSTCELSPVTISGANVTNSTDILWTSSGNGVFNNPAIANPVYTPGTLDAAIGQVILTISAGGNTPCPDVSDILLLTIQKAPQVNAGPDAVTCVGTGHTITQATASDYSTLQWSLSPLSAGSLTNSTTLNPTFVPASGFSGMATLTLSVKGSGPCGDIVISDVMYIFLNTELVADAGTDQTIYLGTATGLSGSVTGGSGFYAWSWQPADLLIDPSVSNPATLPLSTETTFTLTVMDLSTGCIDTDEMTVKIGSGSNSILAIADYDTTLVNVPLTIDVLSNDINPQGDPLIVSLCGFPTHGIVVLNSDKTITYTPYTDYEGDDMFCYRICNALQPSLCSDTMVFIRVKKPDLNDIFVFNGVSPNGDGNNDTWKIRGIEKYPDNTIMIFNRWGDKVIEFANYNNTTRSWNGSNENGDPLPNGTYFYILDVKNVGVLKGWIYVRGEK